MVNPAPDHGPIPVSLVLQDYLDQRLEHVSNKSELVRRVAVLSKFWGEQPVTAISKQSCLNYAKGRSASAARRELQDLRAAVNLAVEDGKTTARVVIKFPPKPPSRYQFLTRSQVAALVWAAFRRRKTYTYGIRSTPETRGMAIKTRHKPSVHLARFTLAAVYTGSRSSRLYRASFEQEHGRPWIDLDNGLFYRSWNGEVVPSNKRAATIRIPRRLLAHMRRWRRLGARYLVEVGGKPVDPKRAFRKLVREVLEDESHGVCRHTLRHTAATWLMQSGVNPNEIAGFLSMSVEVLIGVYAHHHPSHQLAVDRAFSRGHAGRSTSE